MRTMRSVVLLMLATMAAMLPALASAWWNDEWDFRTRLTLDPAALQPVLAADLQQVPILVRLHEGNFNFMDARPDGTDLRFVLADDKTPLSYHIETYDSVASLAYVWVKVPRLQPGTPQEVWLYYGNKEAQSVSNAPMTWDGETVLVYHFNETAGPPRDQTANANNAMASNATPSFDALIRQGVSLNGNQQIRVASSSSLALKAGSPMTWSLWVKPEAQQPQANSVLLAKLSSQGESAPARMTLGLRENRVYASVTADDGSVTEVVSEQQIQINAWTHVALTVDESLNLFVGGRPVGSAEVVLPELNGEVIIGAGRVVEADAASTSEAPAEDAAEDATLTGFIGMLDELVMANIARPAAWVAVAASTQGRDAALVGFSAKPEARGAWFSGGYFGILLGAVTVDGWVVIGILVVMLFISIGVMYSRLMYVKHIAASNRRFAAEFTDIITRMGKERRAGRGGEQILDSIPPADDSYSRASLYRLFWSGVREMKMRAAIEDDLKLDAVSADSLRATLDSALVKEQQELNKQMVILTISISGGPFLGLLGTVVGVMITFAAIAEAGDVNVNAIAPGVAAALMATVAGLAVAIPALFAYNYLTTRIGEIVADMQVFANEFVSRMTDMFRA